MSNELLEVDILVNLLVNIKSTVNINPVDKPAVQIAVSYEFVNVTNNPVKVVRSL